MKALIEKLDSMVKELENTGPFGTHMNVPEIIKMLNHMKQLVLAEQERIVKELEDIFDTPDDWVMCQVRDSVIRIVKDEG